MKYIFQTFLIILLLSTSARATESMRRCMLLPINDSVGGAIGFKVFQEVELYLKDSEWCYYRPNSEIINILGNYKKNLEQHLDNPKVLKVLSEKTNSGSLIKINIVNDIKGVDLKVKVIADNGEDIYFREETKLEGSDPLLISQTVKNWLDVYEKTIPYDGRIIGVLGHQFTVDVGKSYGVLPNTGFEILRPIRKKRHPLLKEIVEWETEIIGSGIIFHVNDVQSQGKMQEYTGKKRLQVGDWLVLKKKKTVTVEDRIPFEDDKDYEFGKLGQIGVFFNFGTGSDTITDSSNNIKKLGGTLLGIDLKGEIWATRLFWGSLEIGRKFGTFKKKEGSLTVTSNSVNTGRFKIKFGYKYLPLGFFYGPQVDAYLGYARYNYGLDPQTSDGFSEVTFKGLLLGSRGSIPIMKKFRLHLELDLMIKPGFEEDVSIYGEADSTSNFHIELGASYAYSPSMTLEGGLGFTSNKAKFESPEQSVSLKETEFKIGTLFTF